MIKRLRIPFIVTCLLCAVPVQAAKFTIVAAVADEPPFQKRASSKTLTDGAKAKTRKLIVSHDQQALFIPAFVIAEKQKLDGKKLERLIRETVDVHAAAGVDMVSLCFFARYSTGIPHCRTAQTWKPTPDLFPRPANDHLYNGLKKLGDRDRMQIVVDQCHRRRIQCIANIRMNDRHRVTAFVKELYRQHPEWRLKSPKGAFLDRQGALNFKYKGVRDRLLAFTAELLKRYDVDGLELDYMRMCHMFEPTEARQHAHLLTKMMRSMRAQLPAAAAQRRDRRSLMLGVRVPSTLKECELLGYEVETWIREGLIDYVTPTDFWSTDFVARTEKFVALTKQTSCKVYPNISPPSSFPTPDRSFLTRAQYKAAANNFYAFGADGLSAYNYFWTWAYNHRGLVAGLGNVWPTRSLDVLTPLKDPAACRQGAREYLAYPLWTGKNQPLWHNQSPTGVVRRDKIVLTANPQQNISSTRLRAAEQPTDRLEFTLQMIVTGMTADDHLLLSLNNHKIPESRLKKDALKGPGRQRLTLALDAGFLRFGDNTIAAAVKTAREKYHVEIDRFILSVRPRE